MKLADFMSPTAAGADQGSRVVNLKSSALGFGGDQEPSFTDVSKIKRRKHARKLFGAIEQAWVPSLKRIKADAFDTLKLKSMAAMKAMAPLAYASVQSFGMMRNNNQDIDNFVLERALSQQTANFEGEATVTVK